MAREQRVTKNSRKFRAGAEKGSRTKGAGAGKRRKKPITLMAYDDDADLKSGVDTILTYYRPLKKPVTLRLDADVLAWFKKDGKRYQTRINGALRRVMEREMKAGG